MKKTVKLTACLLILVLMLGTFCGCIKQQGTGEDSDETALAELTIGLPFDENSACWSDIQEMIADFEEMNDAKVTLVKVPEVGTEEYSDFIDKVAGNKIDMFLSASNDKILDLIENKKIASVTTMVGKDNRITESLIPAFKDISREADGTNYMIPVNAVYQGLYLNKDVFTSAGVALPTDWNSLMSAITALKAKGVTPFAAGFQDGASFWLDELILAEGGKAEHSSYPVKGIINGWERAVNQLVSIYKMGAFSAGALEQTHADAVSAFQGKQAAMILCSSQDMAGVEDENVQFMPFPKTPTGTKEDGTVIAKANCGFYLNAKTLNKNVDDATAMSYVMIEFLNSYVANSDYYSSIFQQSGTCPVSKSVSDTVTAAPASTAFSVVSAAEQADAPLENVMLTFDKMESGLVDVLSGSTSVKDYLSDVSNAEINAQKEKAAAEKD